MLQEITEKEPLFQDELIMGTIVCIQIASQQISVITHMAAILSQFQESLTDDDKLWNFECLQISNRYNNTHGSYDVTFPDGRHIGMNTIDIQHNDRINPAAIIHMAAMMLHSRMMEDTLE